MKTGLTNPITLDEARVIRDSGYLTPLEARLSKALVVAMQESERLRNDTIEEVAKRYHDELAAFSRWMAEKQVKKGLPGFADEWIEKAIKHETYAKEIRGQEWLKDFPQRNEVRVVTSLFIEMWQNT